MADSQMRADVCEVGRRLWQKGLIGATEGNLSVRLDAERLLCTPSGKSKGHLQPDDLVLINLAGEPLGAERPSSEIRLHTRIYQDRPDCLAVVHAHPPTATGMTIAGASIPDDILPEAVVVLGPVATIPFAMPTTPEVPSMIGPFLADHKTFLLSHHGAVTLGTDIFDAANRMETLERVAAMLLVARQWGAVQAMPQAAFDALAPTYLNGRLTS